MNKAFTIEDLQSMQNTLRDEFNVEITLMPDEQNGFQIQIPKSDDVKDKLYNISVRITELANKVQEQAFFNRECLVYLLCVDKRGNKLAIRNNEHRMLTDATLIEKAHMHFEDIKRGRLTIGKKKIRLKTLNEVRIARDIEQMYAINAELSALGY